MDTEGHAPPPGGGGSSMASTEGTGSGAANALNPATVAAAKSEVSAPSPAKVKILESSAMHIFL
jgi:hypothetical protein